MIRKFINLFRRREIILIDSCVFGRAQQEQIAEATGAIVVPFNPRICRHQDPNKILIRVGESAVAVQSEADFTRAFEKLTL